MFSRALSRSVNAALLVTMCTLGSGMSQAQTPDSDTVAVKVSTAGIDLKTPAGAQAMFTRLTIAAQQACGVEAEFDALRVAKFDQCYKDALSKVIRSLNEPAITRVYVAHYPREAAHYGIDGPDYVAGR
jgi:UrcA family protein